MMAKLNIGKISGPDPIRTENQRGAKVSDNDQGQTVENRRVVTEDKLDISGRAMEVGNLVDQLKQLPDTRHELVNNLREQISQGTYKPSGDDIADAILNDERG